MNRGKLSKFLSASIVHVVYKMDETCPVLCHANNAISPKGGLRRSWEPFNQRSGGVFKYHT